MSLRNKITHALIRAEEWIFANPKIVLGMIFTVTLLFATQLPNLRIYTDFADLLPQKHPYIRTYNQIKENFGGANMIVMAIEVDAGTILNNETLALVYRATQGIDSLPSVNHNLVSSLTHRTSRKVYLTADGNFASESYYDAQKAQLLAGLGRWRLLLMIATMIELLLVLSITLPIILWPGTFAHLFVPMHHQLGTSLLTTVLAAMMILPIVSLFAVPQIYLAGVLRPVLTDAPRSDERITVAEQLPKIAASVSGKVLVVGLIAGLAMMSGSILQMFDAFLEGHLVRSAPPNAATGWPRSS